MSSVKTRPQNCIDLIYESDDEIMYELRSQSYRRQYGSNVDTTKLKWKPWDQRFINLGLFIGGQLCSLLRIAYIKDPEDYQKIMLCEFDFEKHAMPVVILSRAATREGFESKGLHTLLRWHAFELTKASGAKAIMGTFKKESKRVSQLLSMGYELTLNPRPWDFFLKTEEETYIANLNISKNFNRATERMLEKISDIKDLYPVNYNKIELVERMLKA